ncbi:MAG TPA: DUF4238 domain-containing protein [Terriglobales bacterium]|nr:DUF4238 domain-containing protein [Terriglobales bacterium]
MRQRICPGQRDSHKVRLFHRGTLPWTRTGAILVVVVTKRQWQHYLPQVYLKGFATQTGEVWRYDRDNGALKPLGTPIIGAETDLYTIITGNELSQEIETKWFSPLDGTFGPIRRKLESRQEPSAEELTHLANFVAYLRVRTPAMIRETETRFRQTDTLLGPDRNSIKYHAEHPDHAAGDYTMTEEQCESVSPRRADNACRNDVLKVLVKTGMQLARVLLDLEWTLLLAPDQRSFIIGDNPFVIVPPEPYDVDLQGVGPMTPGAAVFVPLCSRLCLRVTNSGNPVAGFRQIDGAAVRAINACIVLNSEQYLFSPSDALLKRLIADLVAAPGKNLAQVVLREASSVSDESHSLVHWFTKSKIGPEWAGRVPMG